MYHYTVLHYSIPGSRGMFIGSRTWPPLHLDAVVAMRSESRAAPRAIATVIFSFCFFVMPVFVCRTADRHTRAALRKKGKHSQAHAGVCTDGRDAQRPDPVPGTVLLLYTVQYSLYCTVPGTVLYCTVGTHISNSMV